MQEKTTGTKHGHRTKVVELHVPGNNRDQQRLHIVRRRVRNAPWWMWAVTVLILVVGAYVSGGLRSDGRSSVLAEQLEQARAEANSLSTENTNLSLDKVVLEEREAALTNEVNQLDEALADSVSAEAHAELEAQWQAVVNELGSVRTELNETKAELTELRPQLERANTRVEQLEETVIPALQRQLEFQSNRASRLQATLTVQERALPGQIVAQLNTSPPIELAEYRIAVSQRILRESFGIRFGSINDETLAVTVGGTAAFGPSERATASGNEISIGLPKLILAGLTGFTPDSYAYEAGFLARVGDQDVSDLMVWVEANQLQPKACGDTASLRGLVSQVEQRVKASAGEHDIEVVWVDSAGREFDSSQLTNTVLLQSAC